MRAPHSKPIGLTDQRIIILAGFFSREVKSLPLSALSDITFNERSDKRGTITFGPSNIGYSMMGSAPWPGAGKRTPPTFDLIDNARHVYAVIREAQQSARAAKAA